MVDFDVISPFHMLKCPCFLVKSGYLNRYRAIINWHTWGVIPQSYAHKKIIHLSPLVHHHFPYYFMAISGWLCWHTLRWKKRGKWTPIGFSTIHGGVYRTFLQSFLGELTSHVWFGHVSNIFWKNSPAMFDFEFRGYPIFKTQKITIQTAATTWWIIPRNVSKLYITLVISVD